jgi:hypothetical protein
VAARLGATVTAVVLAGSAGGAPALLAAAGAGRVLVAEHPLLATYAPETYARALAALVAQRAPFAVLGGWTSRGRDFLPRVAARLAAGMTGDVVGLDVDPHPGDPSTLDLVWLKPAWSGTALARVVARTVPSFGTLRPGAVHESSGRLSAGSAALRPLAAEPPGDSGRLSAGSAALRPLAAELPGARTGSDVPVEFVAAEPGEAGRSRLIDVADQDAHGLLDASARCSCWVSGPTGPPSPPHHGWPASGVGAWPGPPRRSPPATSRRPPNSRCASVRSRRD